MNNIILGFYGLLLSLLIMVISLKLIIMYSNIISIIFMVINLFGLCIWIIALEVSFNKRGCSDND